VGRALHNKARSRSVLLMNALHQTVAARHQTQPVKPKRHSYNPPTHSGAKFYSFKTVAYLSDCAPEGAQERD
jgi:hypothetical protein